MSASLSTSGWLTSIVAFGVRTTVVSRTTLAIMILVTAAPMVAQKPAPAPPDTSVITPAMVDLGRAIFHGKGMCFACHGAQLEGSQIAPTLKAHAWRDAKNGEFPAIFYVVTHGVRGTVMVAFPGGIRPAEALSVASYIWSVSQGKVKP